MLLQKPSCPYADQSLARAWLSGFELRAMDSDYARLPHAWAEGRACRTIAIAQAAQRYATAPTFEQATVIYNEAVALYSEAEVDKALLDCPVGIPWEGTPSRPKAGPWRMENPPDYPTAGKFPTVAPWGRVWSHEQFTEAKNTAREAALQYGKPYAYTPKNEFEAQRWEPHHWVLMAMQRAYLAGQISAMPADMSDSLAPAPAQTPFDVDDSDVLDLRAPVVRLLQGDTSPKASNALHKLDKAIAEAVAAYKDSDAPQGLLVALLHAHSTRQTQLMLDA